MITVSHILKSLEKIAPANLAYSFDKIGLQVGSVAQELSLGGLTCLDATESLLSRTYSQEPFDIVIAHHPLIWDPIAKIDPLTVQGSTIQFLCKHNIAFIAAHTNWDTAKGGVNDVLAKLCELSEVQSFGQAPPEKLLKLVTFAPAESLDRIRFALEEAGAGLIGEYSGCAYTSEGQGYFTASPNSNPVVGTKNTQNIIREVRLEMRVNLSHKMSCEKALLAAHPYETPGYDWIILHDGPGQMTGRIGAVEPTSLRDYLSILKKNLDSPVYSVANPDLRLDTVAVFGGSGAGEWRAARAAGAQAMVTGEAAHHILVEAAEYGFALICAGHYATEAPAMGELASRLNDAENGLKWRVAYPEPGESGRTFS